MDISIIIPVYNVEKFLLRCLDSIFNQQLSGSFEVIAVDDGSTDRSLEILKEYEIKESRLNVIAHQGNKKLSVARRTGMNASSGNFIMHVDADDWILPGSLELLLRKCKSSDADVIVFDYIREDSNGKQLLKANIKHELLTKDKLSVQKYFFDACVLKIVKRRLIENMIYGTIGMNSVEDLLYSTEILLRADSILLLNEVLYVYFVNQTSITQTVNLKTLLDNQIVVYSELQKILNTNSYKSDFKKRLFAQRENVIIFLLLRNHFSEKKYMASTDYLVNNLQQFYSPDDKSLLRLEQSAKNKYFCMIQYGLSVGIINILSLLLRKLVLIGKTRIVNSKRS